MMRTKVVLIDYENVRTFSSGDLSVLRADEIRVKLFLGVHNREIGVDLVDALLPIGSRVELIRLRTAGTNALDLFIAFYIGKLWHETPESTFYIISKDSDYNPLIKNLKAIGVDVHRRYLVSASEARSARASLQFPAVAADETLNPENQGGGLGQVQRLYAAA
jgi:hypothetical protein